MDFCVLCSGFAPLAFAGRFKDDEAIIGFAICMGLGEAEEEEEVVFFPKGRDAEAF